MYVLIKGSIPSCTLSGPWTPPANLADGSYGEFLCPLAILFLANQSSCFHRSSSDDERSIVTIGFWWMETKESVELGRSQRRLRVPVLKKLDWIHRGVKRAPTAWPQRGCPYSQVTFHDIARKGVLTEFGQRSAPPGAASLSIPLSLSLWKHAWTQKEKLKNTKR